jgi:3-hydroxyisobutyrate dehydrogenase
MSPIRQIAVIGTGNMGAPMSRNLAQAGFAVCAYDIVEEKLAPLAKQGVRACANHADAIAGADMILTMLPTAVEVRDVFERHITPHAGAGCLLVDSSTIDLEDARNLHRDAGNSGLAMLDAPVSGGTAGAASGKLTFMVGGDPAHLEAARPALDAMGSRVIHCGGPGMGQAAKMCNNMMLGIQMASVVEGFHLARKVGLDNKKLYEVASSSSANCFSLTAFCPVPDVVEVAPANGGYQPGFSTDLMLKDMGIALNAAQQGELPLTLAPVAASIYRRFSEAGHGGLDFSAIYRLLDPDTD